MSELKDRKRFTIELSNRLDNELEELSEKTGRKKSELLRLAIEYILAAQEAKEEGLKVGAWSIGDSGELQSTREFLGIR
jgi:predicted transcriptional regulator